MNVIFKMNGGEKSISCDLGVIDGRLADSIFRVVKWAHNRYAEFHAFRWEVLAVMLPPELFSAADSHAVAKHLVREGLPDDYYSALIEGTSWEHTFTVVE